MHLCVADNFIWNFFFFVPDVDYRKCEFVLRMSMSGSSFAILDVGYPEVQLCVVDAYVRKFYQNS